MDTPGGVDQVKCIPPVVGLGENLETLKWYERFAAEIRCRVCGIVVGCRVLRDGEMHHLDYNFWRYHFEQNHAAMLKVEAPGVNPGPKANDETDSEVYPQPGPLSNAKEEA